MVEKRGASAVEGGEVNGDGGLLQDVASPAGPRWLVDDPIADDGDDATGQRQMVGRRRRGGADGVDDAIESVGVEGRLEAVKQADHRRSGGIGEDRPVEGPTSKARKGLPCRGGEFIGLPIGGSTLVAEVLNRPQHRAAVPVRGSESGHQVMAEAISGVGVGCVCRIFGVRNIAARGVVLEIRAKDIDQRTVNPELDARDRKRVDGPHRSQPVEPGPPAKMEQKRLDPVVAVVAEGDIVDTPVTGPTADGGEAPSAGLGLADVTVEFE